MNVTSGTMNVFVDEMASSSDENVLTDEMNVFLDCARGSPYLATRYRRAVKFG
jgi:hypothetical protein